MLVEHGSLLLNYHHFIFLAIAPVHIYDNTVQGEP